MCLIPGINADAGKRNGGFDRGVLVVILGVLFYLLGEHIDKRHSRKRVP